MSVTYLHIFSSFFSLSVQQDKDNFTSPLISITGVPDFGESLFLVIALTHFSNRSSRNNIFKLTLNPIFLVIGAASL